jgi:hypothetical protein
MFRRYIVDDLPFAVMMLAMAACHRLQPRPERGKV